MTITPERMRLQKRAAAILGHYFSTHCQHEHHNMCKDTCKHCEEACVCECHTPPQEEDR